MDSAQGPALAPIFGDLSQSEKLSEIKPPLKTPQSFNHTKYLVTLVFLYLHEFSRDPLCPVFL